MSILDTLFGAIKSMVSTGETVQAEPVEIEKKFDALAQASDAKDWRNSIVDLLKLAGMDSSFNARRKLAEECGIPDYHGTAGQNVTLHAEVLKKMKEGGLKLPG